MNVNQYSAEELINAANAGNVEAKTELGRRYMFGENGFEANPDSAKKWLEAAADANDPKALRLLGTMYLGEHGIPCDYDLALSLLTSAAEAGDARAMAQLGRVYMEGIGVEGDMNQAAEWFHKAADAGLIQGLSIWGMLQRIDLFSFKNTENAARCFEAIIAHETDPDLDDSDRKTIADAYNSLGDMYKEGDPFPADINRAIELYTKAAEGGNDSAQLTLGLLYTGILDESIPRDTEKALYWLQMATLAGNEEALTALGGFCTIAEDRTPEEVAAARNYLKLAADGGSTFAQTLLGTILLQEGNSEEAIPLLEAAAEDNDANALYPLAHHYIITVNTPESRKKGAVYAEKAAASGEEPRAKLLLAYLYADGLNNKKDLEKATELLREALAEGASLENGDALLKKLEAHGLAIKGCREDFMRMEDLSADVETILSLIRAEEGPCRNSAADTLIKNALTYEKLGNTEKLLECCISVTNTYPDDIRGWLFLLLTKSEKLKPYFLPVFAEHHSELEKIMTYVLRLADTEEEINQTCRKIFSRYQNNCQAFTNALYLKMTEEMHTLTFVKNHRDEWDNLLEEYGLSKVIPTATEGLYSLAHYVLTFGIQKVMIIYQQLDKLKSERFAEKERLKAQGREQYRKTISSDMSVFEKVFEDQYKKEILPQLETQWREFETQGLKMCDIHPSANPDFSACIEQLRPYAGTDDEFIEMLESICIVNSIPGYFFLDDFLSQKALDEREARRKAEEEAEAAAEEAERAAKAAAEAAELAKIAPEDTPKSRWLTALSYLGILFLIPAFLDQDSKFNRFHVNQGGTLFAIQLAARILFNWILGGWFFSFIGNVIGFGCLVLSIMGLYNIYQNVQKKLPVTGEMTFISKLLDMILK